MTNGVAAGQLLSDLIEGRRSPQTDIFDPGRLHPRVEALGLAKAGASIATHVVTDRLRPSGSVSDIEPGQGAVVRIGGKQCAVYRNEKGETIAVSATCSHLGCLVGFNDAERSWDCPCHGSRFDIDGAILQGPAVTPLMSVPLEDIL